MPESLFATCSPRLGLPLLYVGQSQKEATVNELAARVDMLTCLAIEGEMPSPPASAAEGQSWLVAANPTGEWSGQAGKIAALQGGNWLFAAPFAGLRMLDKSTGQEVRFTTGWKRTVRPALPSGGAIVDSEARSAIAALVSVLSAAGIVPAA